MTIESIVIKYREKGDESIAIVEEGDEREEIISPALYDLIDSIIGYIKWCGGKVVSIEGEIRITYEDDGEEIE